MTWFSRIFIFFAVIAAFTQGQDDNNNLTTTTRPITPATTASSSTRRPTPPFSLPTSSSSSTSQLTTPAGVAAESPPPPPPPPASTTNTAPTWTVRSSTNSSSSSSISCVLVSGNFSFAVTYSNSPENSISKRVDIPSTARVSGSCGPFVNTLVLTWSVTSSSQGNLTFMFIKKPIYDAGVDTGEGTYSLVVIFGQITVGNPNNGGHTFNIRVKPEPDFMSTRLHNSFSCESFQSVPADSSRTVYLEMRNVQIEAFHNGPGEFSTKQPCSKDIFSSVMSNIGYVAIAVLIAAVVGYLGWKKFIGNRAAGYTQV